MWVMWNSGPALPIAETPLDTLARYCPKPLLRWLGLQAGRLHKSKIMLWAIINIFTLTEQGSTLDVRILRLHSIFNAGPA